MLATLFAAAALAFGQAETRPAPPETTESALSTGTVAESVEGDLEAYVDGLVAVWMTEEPAPALVVSVTDADGLIFAKGYGLADIEAGTPATGSDTRFEIGSISKTFIWTAVMMLEEQGRLDLDTPVNTYLTGYQAADGESPLTLAHLMSHRTGHEDTLSLFLPHIAAMEIDDALAAAEPALVSERGAAVAYSNWGSTLAARVVEEVTGRDYADFLYTEILQPLGMENTTYRERDARDDQPQLAASYDPAAGFIERAFRADIGVFSPAGSIASTGEDMARWMRFHLNGGELDGVRLLRADTHARMQERLFPGREDGADMAHGFMSRPYRDQTFWGHGGAINSFLSNMQLVQPLGLGVFVSQSGTRAGAYRRLPQLVVDRALGLDPVNAPPPGRLSLGESELEIYAGRYTANRREAEGFEKLITGLGVLTVSAGTDALIVDGERFWPVAEDVFQNRLGERLVFMRDENGAVIRIADSGGANSFDPVAGDTDPLLLGLAFVPAVLFSITIWLGLWRRMGRGQTVTLVGRLLSAFDLAAAALVFAYLACFLAAAASLMDVGFEFVAGYPQPALIAVAAMSQVMLALAVVAILAIAPVMTASGWSIWRKAHHTLFALSLGLLAVTLVRWDLALSWPVSP